MSSRGVKRLTPSVTRQKRCVNCSFLIPRNLRTHSLEEASTPMINMLQSWITPTQLTSGCVHCTECLILLQDRANTISEGSSSLPAFGHRSICYSCGKSILRVTRTYPVRQDRLERKILVKQVPLHLVSRLEKSCAACWRSATREAQRCDQHLNSPGLLPGAGLSGDLNFPESPPLLQQNNHTPQYEDSLQPDDGNEIKVFCPKCNAEISHTAEGIQEDQIKILIARVYHYFEQEYEELKKSFDGLELTPLSKFRERTALATGVSETTVVQILQEEARRNAEAREEPSPNDSRARKRPRQTDTEREQTLVVKEEPAEEPLESYNEEPEIYVEMPEVKDEPGVSGANDALADPISIDLKTEPQNEEATSSDTTVVQSTTKSHKRRITKRNTEAPTAASAPPSLNAPPAPPRRHSNDTPVVQSATNSYKRRKTKQNTEAPTVVSAPPTPNAPPAAPRRQNLLLDDGDIKMEQIESDEGFS